MFKISVKNLSNVETHSGKFSSQEELDSFKNSCIARNLWGKAAGSYPIQELSSSELAQEISRTTDEYGNTLVEIPVQYTTEITDISSQVAQDSTNTTSLKYLADTDWYVIRYLETGVAIPADITTARAAARASIVR